MRAFVRISAAMMVAASALVAVPASQVAWSAPAAEAEAVGFSVDGKQLVDKDRVAAGRELKIVNVPPGSQILLHDYKDPAKTVAVHPTDKERVFKSDPLPAGWRLWAKVKAPDGSTAKVNFIVGSPGKTFDVSVFPAKGTWGVGMPLVVDFGVPITRKADVERALVVEVVKSGEPVDIGEASWHWTDSSTIVFRPRDYWPGNVKISLKADLTGIEGAAGWYGPKVDSHFRTGDRVIMRVNLKTHEMKFERNGEVEKTFPISGGKPGWQTASGIKVVTGKFSPKRLYNPGPNGWDVTVKYGIRVTDDGEYIHDSDWNGSIGYANTSHGCTNMWPSDMAWVYRNTSIGDVAEYKGSSSKLGTGHYLSGYWNYDWNVWKQGSALFAR
ncbi:MAG: Ig-like domain-containing protein [bacterium]